MTKEFGNQLRKSISDSGYTVYQLAGLADVDRTYIQKTLSGQRLISERDLQKILDVLHLSHEERALLLQNYEICRVGKNKFSQINYVKELIQSMVNNRQFDQSEFPLTVNLQLTENSLKGNLFYRGSSAIVSLLRTCLVAEIALESSPFFYLFVPADNDFLGRILPLPGVPAGSGGGGGERPEILQLVQFTKNREDPADDHHNLRVLNAVLPFCLSRELDYTLYYYYGLGLSGEDEGMILPYYVVTNRLVLLLSGDMETALVLTDGQTVEFYKNSFLSRLRQARRLTREYNHTDDCLDSFLHFNLNCRRLFWLEYQSALYSLLDRNLLESALLPEYGGKERLFQCLERVEELLELENPPVCIFSETGLKQFAEDGTLPGLSVYGFRPFTPGERLILLRRLEAAANRSQRSVYMVNPRRFEIPDCVCLSVGENIGVNFIMQVKTGGLRNIYIRENTLAGAFLDFVTYSLVSDLVYSRENTVDIIRGCIAGLEDKGL